MTFREVGYSGIALINKNRTCSTWEIRLKIALTGASNFIIGRNILFLHRPLKDHRATTRYYQFKRWRKLVPSSSFATSLSSILPPLEPAAFFRTHSCVTFANRTRNREMRSPPSSPSSQLPLSHSFFLSLLRTRPPLLLLSFSFNIYIMLHLCLIGNHLSRSFTVPVAM